MKKKNETSQDLASLIKGRQNNRLDSLISNLEAKYGKKKGTKRSSKDIDDDEFERIQAQMFKRVMGLHNFAYNEFTKTILVKIVG